MNIEIKEKLLKEYESRQQLYVGYSLLVKNLLEEFLTEKNLKFQIFHRAKDKEKLAKKIDKKFKEDGKLYRSLNEIEDLAGVRVVFYIEDDKKAAIQSLYEEFEKCISKSEEKYKPKGYQATHLIFRLDKGRTRLAEYNKYVNLTCEIQVVTILFHAWSEVEHDIIYKPKGQKKILETLGLDNLKKRFEKIMAEHIQAATIELNLINKEYKSITRIGNVLAKGFLTDIEKSKNNDEIFEKLKLFEEFYQKKPDETFTMIKWIINKSPQPPRLLHRFSDADLYGKDHNDLIEECVELLSKIRYWKTQDVFSLLIKLSASDVANIKSKSIKALEEFAKYNYFALQKIGFTAQVIILNEVEKWNQDKIVQNIEALLIIAHELLDPSFEGTSWKADKMTFHSGPIGATKNLKKIRQRTIKILEKAYLVISGVENKKKIIQTLQDVAHMSGNYYKFEEQKNVEAMRKMVKNDAEAVVDWYIKIVPKAENSILLTLEEIAFSIRRSSANTVKNVDKLYKALEKNKEYQIYRALVGYDYKLYDYRERDDLDREASERKKKIQEFVRDIKVSNIKAWVKRLSDIAEELKVAIDRSLHFNTMDFLRDIGKQKPKVAIELLGVKQLEPFYPSLLRGMLQSESNKKAKQFIIDWMDKTEHLGEIAGIFLLKEIKIDISVFNKLFKKARDQKNQDVLTAIARVVITRYSHKNKQLEKLLSESLEELKKFDDSYSWSAHFWTRDNKDFSAFLVKYSDLVLQTLLNAPTIDYNFEEIMAPIAKAHPKKIIVFFRKRVDIRTKRKEKDLIDRYSAVPYDFHVLGKVLREHERIVVTELMKWYKLKGKEPWRFRWDASHLIKNIFPGFSPLFEKELIIHIKKGGNIGIIYDILQAQKGEGFLWGIVREVIKKYHTGKKAQEIQEHFFGYLSQMGVVNGERGMVDGYKGKRKHLEKLAKNEKDKHVKKFIDAYGKYLDNQIVYHEKDADEQIALRKRGIF